MPAVRERLAAAMVGRTMDGEPLIGPPTRRSSAARAPTTSNDFTYDADPRRACAARSARTSAAATRATPTCRPARRGFVSRLKRTLGFDAAGAATRIWSPRRASIACCAAGREYGTGCRAAPAAPRRARPACTSSASAPTSRASSSSCRARGWSGASSTACRARAIRCSATACPAPDGTPTDGFSMPQADGPDRRSAGLPQFVTVRGGAYFFLPGIRALRYLASAPKEDATP